MNNNIPGYFNQILPNPFMNGFNQDIQGIKNFENRISNLEKDVTNLKNRINRLENFNNNDNYSTNYKPNAYNMM